MSAQEPRRPAPVESPYVAALVEWLAEMHRRRWAREQAEVQIEEKAG